jgi:hypothetical protein
MRGANKKHILYLGILLLIIVGFLVSIFFFANNNTKKYNFAPTPTMVPTPSEYRKILPADQETTSWQTFTDDKLKYSIQYPKNITIDKRQTVKDRITAFVFEEDKTASLPGKVTALFLADTHKKGIDGFTAFSRSDCGSNCNASYKNTDWVNINNVYGIKNPLPNDVHNYYLTDKNQSGSVINAYVGGYINNDKDVQNKIDIFEEMIKTIKFNR